MRIVFLYNEAGEDPSQAVEEIDPARSPIVAALRELGHEVKPLACTLDLSAARRWIELIDPDVVFNRVESLGGSDAMMAAVPLLLDTMHVAYTGCTAEGLAATADKLTVKERLVRAGLPTPGWITADGQSHGLGGCQIGDANRRFIGKSSEPSAEAPLPRFILKSTLEHASFELDDAAIIDATCPDDVKRKLQQRIGDTGRPFFAEQFIDGREFNLSVWGREPCVLPPAEIDFSAFPAGKPRIVAHGAKWDASSFEYHHTPRRFDFPPADAPLLDRLCDLAIQCARLFNLGGHARIDFRCTPAGEPLVLEINSNPCLSPDAGYAAALAEAGFRYEDGLEELLQHALNRRRPGSRPESTRLSRYCRPQPNAASAERPVPVAE